MQIVKANRCKQVRVLPEAPGRKKNLPAWKQHLAFIPLSLQDLVVSTMLACDPHGVYAGSG